MKFDSSDCDQPIRATFRLLSNDWRKDFVSIRLHSYWESSGKNGSLLYKFGDCEVAKILNVGPEAKALYKAKGNDTIEEVWIPSHKSCELHVYLHQYSLETIRDCGEKERSTIQCSPFKDFYARTFSIEQIADEVSEERSIHINNRIELLAGEKIVPTEAPEIAESEVAETETFHADIARIAIDAREFTEVVPEANKLNMTGLEETLLESNKKGPASEKESKTSEDRDGIVHVRIELLFSDWEFFMLGISLAFIAGAVFARKFASKKE